MILARVVDIVATKKNQRYENASVMLCQQIDLREPILLQPFWR